MTRVGRIFSSGDSDKSFRAADSTLELLEERFIYLVGSYRFKPQLQAPKHFDELFSIDELNRRHSLSCSLASCLRCECAIGDHNAVIRPPPSHRSPEITNVRGRYRTLVPLTLEK